MKAVGSVQFVKCGSAVAFILVHHQQPADALHSTVRDPFTSENICSDGQVI